MFNNNTPNFSLTTLMVVCYISLLLFTGIWFASGVALAAVIIGFNMAIVTNFETLLSIKTSLLIKISNG
jgi:hypothetical protein